MSVCLKKLCISLMLILLFSPSAYAESTGHSLVEKISDNLVIDTSVSGCDEDIKEHCDGLGDNSDKILLCLIAYEDQIAEQCKRGVLEAALSISIGVAALDYSIRACEIDADKHCLNVQPGEGRLVNCIKANEPEVSEECITALKETGLWELGK